MRVYHFSEQPYPNAWSEPYQGSLRVILPNRKCDPGVLLTMSRPITTCGLPSATPTQVTKPGGLG